MEHPILWGAFALVVLTMLALDLGVLNRGSSTPTVRQALTWTLVWVGLALAFAAGIFFRLGPGKALEFLTGYVIEESLSVDNIFVFLVIFSYFAVPAELQRRVLIWGVLGAIVLRGLFILAGAALLHHFHWIVFVFGGFLIFTGIKLLTQQHSEMDPEQNPVVGLFRRFVPMTQRYHGPHFFVSVDGRRYATPLLLVLLVVEFTDIVFAVDSIPAIFAVTRDPFIVLTSNVFAIMGLRSLYFLLSGAVDKLRYLKVGLGLVLAFVGTKMVLADWVHIPIGVSLAVICALLGGSIAFSLLRPAPPEAEEVADIEERPAA
jgi:tellurite resistance protein TerC